MLTYEIINSSKQFIAISEEWDVLASKQKWPNVFSDFSWIESWWRHFGSDKTLHIVLARLSGVLIGIVPLFYSSKYVINMMQFIGRPGADYSDILLHPDYSEHAGEIWQYIINSSKNTIIRLDGISPDSPSYNCFVSENNLFNRAVKKRIIYNSPFVSITQSWGDYENTLKKRLTQDTARQRRRLNALSELEFDNINDEKDIPALISHMIEQKCGRYRATGAKNIFKDKRYKDFYIDVSTTFFAKGNLDLSHIKLMGQILAIHFGFYYGNKFFYYMPSFNLNYSNYSPSRILLHTMLKKSFSDNHNEFDFLSGDESYKYDWTNSYRQVYGLFIYPDNIKGKLLALVYTRLIPRIKRFTLTKIIIKTIRKL